MYIKGQNERRASVDSQSVPLTYIHVTSFDIDRLVHVSVASSTVRHVVRLRIDDSSCKLEAAITG